MTEIMLYVTMRQDECKRTAESKAVGLLREGRLIVGTCASVEQASIVDGVEEEGRRN
jgi:hypothetical protein